MGEVKGHTRQESRTCASSRTTAPHRVEQPRVSMTRTRTSVLGRRFSCSRERSRGAGSVRRTFVWREPFQLRSNRRSRRRARGQVRKTGGGFEAPLRGPTYPANVIPQAIVRRAEVRSAGSRSVTPVSPKRPPLQDAGTKWRHFGPKKYATQPGATAFSGRRTTPPTNRGPGCEPDCTASHCRLWAGAAGGGVRGGPTTAATR